MTTIDNIINNDYDKNFKDWNKSYYLGIDSIDKQHAIFFQLFDQLKVMNKTRESSDKLKELILDLEKYTNIHFKTEEALFVKSEYVDSDLHIAQHQIFKRKIEDFKIAETYKNSILTDQMIVFMRKWLLTHIDEIDRKYVENVKIFLSEKGNKKNK